MAPKRSIQKTGDNLVEKLHSGVYDEISPSKNSLKGPFVVCVVGASRGIGASIAKAFAAANASAIILAARSSSLDLIQKVAEEIKQINQNVETRDWACDVTSSSSISELASKIDEEFGRLDVLVYNSGFSGSVVLRIADDDPGDIERAFLINSVGAYLAARAFIPLLLKSPNGANMFIAIGSAAAWLTDGPIANSKYCVSKLAQVRLIENIATQYKQDGLFSTVIHPGAVKTEMAGSTPPEFLPCMLSRISTLTQTLCCACLLHPRSY